MNITDWLLPWKAKAKIKELLACVDRENERNTPLVTKIHLLEEKLCTTEKSLRAALDEKHTISTTLMVTRASEKDWNELAQKLDLEKNELASLNRSLCDQLEHARADLEVWKGRVDTERKQREEIETSIGAMKVEVNKAHALAAQATKLEEALKHEVAESMEAKQAVTGLTKWIKAAHRLDSPAPRGTIRRILQSARFKTKAIAGLLLLASLTCLGQAPFWRNPWSTNQVPPVIGTNLWVSNTASGEGYFFYNYPSSNAVARLRDITNTVTAIGGTGGTNFPLLRVTNAAWIGRIDAGITTVTNFRAYTGAGLGQLIVESASGVQVQYSPFTVTTTAGAATFQAGLTNWGGLYVSNLLSHGFAESVIINSNVWITTNGNVGIGTNNPQAAVDVWGTNAPYLIKAGSPSGGTNRLLLDTNGTMSIARDFTAGNRITGGEYIICNGAAASGGFFFGTSSTRLYAPSNGVFKIAANGGTALLVSNWGGYLALDPALGAPIPAASKGLLTNGQFVLWNNAGTFTHTTSTNGTNGLNMLGLNSSNLWVSTQMAPQQPVACYGAMMFNTTNYGQVFGASAYTNIVGFNVWNTNQFTVNTNTGYITNLVAGYYRCIINLSMLGQNAGMYEGCMLTNDVDPDLIAFQHQHDTPARWRSATGGGVIYLPANTGCSFALKCDVPGAIQIKRGSLIIGTP